MRHTIIFFLRSDSIMVVRLRRGSVEEEKVFPLAGSSLSESFRQAVEQFGNTGRVVCAEEYMYVFSLLLQEDVLKDASRLRALCAERVPEDIESVVWDYQILRRKNNLWLVQVSGMKKELSEQLSTLFGELRFFPECIIPESYALAQQFLGQGSVILCQERQGKTLLCHADEGVVSASQVLLKDEKDMTRFLTYVRLQTIDEIRKIVFIDIPEETNSFQIKEELQKEYMSAPLGAVFGVLCLKWRLKKEADILNLKVPRKKISWNRGFRKFFHRIDTLSSTKNMPRKKGFTLIEILLVIGIIAVLATVVIVALDPAKRFADARNARRLSDIQSILAAVQQYIIDNKGVLPTGIDTTEKQIGTASGGCAISSDYCNADTSVCVDLSSELAKYLKSVPYDPGAGSLATTHYSIQANDNNLITVTACDSTDAEIARVSR